MRISDWSSDVCSSDLGYAQPAGFRPPLLCAVPSAHARRAAGLRRGGAGAGHGRLGSGAARPAGAADGPAAGRYGDLLLDLQHPEGAERSEEHTSELQSLMRISYAVLCLKK